ncbi:MAG: DUF790 family protein [Lentisphaeria bacterium]|nr:DUF790 family protein [Lentisphaeria bacterium]
MLTKDLLKCRIERGFVRPRFIDVDSESLRDLAGELLAVYRCDPPPTRAEITELVQPLVNAQPDVILARGMNKLLLDRCMFSQVADLDYAALRTQLFEASARRLAAPEADPESFRTAVIAEAGLPDDFVENGIYADLPENERLLRFRDMTAKELLERYNVGLVQSLLLRAEDLELKISSPDPAKMRRLFKYLKFFRLLARVYSGASTTAARRRERGEAMRIVVDGPASILGQARRYGLQLASFFPAVCALDHWTLDTVVEWKRRRLRLRLTEKTGLVSHYRNFTAYVPEEIQLFHRHFRDTVKEWQVVGSEACLETGSQELVFPDLSFENDGGLTVHLELFHRWHASQLLERLARVEELDEVPLIVGVDRALLKRDGVEAALEASPWFQERGFLFRDYPTVARTVKCLRSCATGDTS